LSEGSRWLQLALSASNGDHSELRPKLLFGAGALASNQGDYARAEQLFTESLQLYRVLENPKGIGNVLDSLGILASRRSEYDSATKLFQESLSLRREMGDKRGIDASLNNLGHVATIQGDYSLARSLLEESLALSRELGDTAGISITLNNLGRVVRNLGDYAAARLLFSESLAIKRELDDKIGIASSLNSLGEVAYHDGEDDLARTLFEESLALCRAIQQQELTANVLNNLGRLVARQGNYVQAWSFYRESLSTLRELGDKQATAIALIGLGFMYTKGGQPELALVLYGAAQKLVEASGARIEPDDQAEYERNLDLIRKRIDTKKWSPAWDKGQAMAQGEAILTALALPQPLVPAPAASGAASGGPVRPPEVPAGLTRREVEVITLVARGLTDAQIAEQLYLSRHTVHAHMHSIFSKLDVSTRSAAARFAIEHGLQ
jgi:ATP/maltotriose-dependent transcriptional regulator MalT